MPKRLDEQLISKIEEAYLKDEAETYASLSERFSVGKSTLERIGKERNWARKRDQRKARRAEKLLKQSALVNQSLETLNANGFTELDPFSKRRLLEAVQKGLLTFETAIDHNSDNPRILASLAGGLTKLVEVYLKLQPLTASDLVEILIRAEIGPDEFLTKLQREKERRLNPFHD